MTNKQMFLNELWSIFFSEGNIKVNAFYKVKKGIKFYYDFSYMSTLKLRGSYDVLEIIELIHFVE